jgi:hypothetical protein
MASAPAGQLTHEWQFKDELSLEIAVGAPKGPKNTKGEPSEHFTASELLLLCMFEVQGLPREADEAEIVECDRTQDLPGHDQRDHLFGAEPGYQGRRNREQDRSAKAANPRPPWERTQTVESRTSTARRAGNES